MSSCTTDCQLLPGTLLRADAFSFLLRARAELVDTFSRAASNRDDGGTERLQTLFKHSQARGAAQVTTNAHSVQRKLPAMASGRARRSHGKHTSPALASKRPSSADRLSLVWKEEDRSAARRSWIGDLKHGALRPMKTTRDMPWPLRDGHKICNATRLAEFLRENPEFTALLYRETRRGWDPARIRVSDSTLAV
jgi:hypothetical protein